MFSDITISQSSVATHLRCDWLCNDPFIANFQLNVTLKEFFENRSIFGEDINKSLGAYFYLAHSVYTSHMRSLRNTIACHAYSRGPILRRWQDNLGCLCDKQAIADRNGYNTGLGRSRLTSDCSPSCPSVFFTAAEAAAAAAAATGGTSAPLSTIASLSTIITV